MLGEDRNACSSALCIFLNSPVISPLLVPMVAKGNRDFRISDLVKNLMELIFNPCGEFRCEVQRAQLAKSSLHLIGAPGMFSDLLRFVQMLKREWGAESNGKLPHLFIPSKTAT